jgi:hypothetical protein
VSSLISHPLLLPWNSKSDCQQLLSLSESESELLYDWQFTANLFVLATSPLRPTTSNFIFQLNTCDNSPCVTSFLTRELDCLLQLLLALVSAVILRSESHGTHYHILLSQVRDFPKPEGQVPVFISPRNRVARLYPRALGFSPLLSLLQTVVLVTSRHESQRKHRLE